MKSKINFCQKGANLYVMDVKYPSHSMHISSTMWMLFETTDYNNMAEGGQVKKGRQNWHILCIN